MGDVLNGVLGALKDLAIAGVAGVILTSVLGIVVSWLKKGKMEAFGNKCGAAVSGFARSKFGAKFWERIEDVITLSILSFVKGFKLGSDMDDSLPDDSHIDAGQVIKAGGDNQSTTGMDGQKLDEQNK